MSASKFCLFFLYFWQNCQSFVNIDNIFIFYDSCNMSGVSTFAAFKGSLEMQPQPAAIVYLV